MAILDILRGNQSDAPPEPVPTKIPALPIRQIIDGERRLYLLKLLSHLRGTQHAHKKYDWDARLLFSADNSQETLTFPVESYVPMKRRRPCVSLRMAKLITKRLTTMIFGHDRFPTITVEGDTDAEDYVRELGKVSKLRTKMIEARDKGGACGTVVLSWGFAEGRPVIDVHSAPLIEVLEWSDYENRIPSVVMKAYDFRKKVYREDGKPEDRTFWRVRYWDTEIERNWEPIPDDVANMEKWQDWPSSTIHHGLGKCPIVWIQNIPNSEDIDGICDSDGQHEDFDEMDRLASATHKGTVANVDPTLVVKDKKGKDETVIRKGSGTTIYSPGGAAYLELSGKAVEAAKSLLQSQKQSELDEAEVVLLDPEKLSGAGVSAASLKVRYAPMLAKCDLIRDQYGDAIVTVMKDMIETARQLREPVAANEDGDRVWSKVELEPRIEMVTVKVEQEGTDAVGNPKLKDVREPREFERSPGTSSRIGLRWPPYFPATWEDRQKGVETATKATGGKQILSQHTAIETLASMFDIEDVDGEIDKIEEDQETQNERARELLEAGAPEPPTNQRQDPKDDGEGDEDDDDQP